MTKTLDLGCGSRPKNPFNADEIYGVDVRDDLDANVRKADLVIEPIPYDDASFEYITAFDFIEHVPRVVYAPHRRNAFVELMNEVYRVLKPDGLFLSMTPAYPHAVTFRDPTHVNFITEETFPLYFDDVNRWASIYGFQGAFRIITHEWRGPHIYAVMQKVPVPTLHKAVSTANQKVSVFVPVYNGERYLETTLNSILAQTYTDFEVLCIDDGSTDSSLDILKRYAENDTRIRVMQTPSNLGAVSKVLNFALPQMHGGFFVYASQDDIFSTNWLEMMCSRAIETDADAVIPDVVFYHSKDETKNRVLSGLRGDRTVELTNREAVKHSLDWTIPGNALWNANLVRKFRFEDFGMNADEYSARVFFLNCNKVVFSEGQFFYRQDNENAVTKKISYKSFDYPYTQFKLYQLLRDQQFPAEDVQAAALKAVDLVRQLRQWLIANPDALSAEDTVKAEDRLSHCVGHLRTDSMFAAVLTVL